MEHIVTTVSFLAILTTCILFAVEFYKALNTTLRTKAEGHSAAEVWALTWFYWFEKMHSRDASAASIEQKLTWFDNASEAKSALIRELGAADWFAPAANELAAKQENTLAAKQENKVKPAPAQAKETPLPEGVSSLAAHRQQKEYLASLKHEYWDE